MADAAESVNFVEIQEEVDANDVCLDFEYSLVFFVVVSLVGISFVVYAVVLCLRRRSGILYGFDLLYILLFTAAAIKFCPSIWLSLKVHGFHQNAPASQTGCKLMTYTTIGMSSVISFLLSGLVLYCWIGGGFAKSLARFHHSVLDDGLKKHLGWLLLATFAVEGAVGMVPAMYMDVTPDGLYCNATASNTFRPLEFVVTYNVLQGVIPYLLPSICWIYPLVVMARNLDSIQDPLYRDATKNVVIATASYAISYVPLAVMSQGVFPAYLNGLYVNWKAVCVMEGVLSFVQDAWYLYLPLLLILRDPELSRNLPWVSTIKDAVASNGLPQRLQMMVTSSQRSRGNDVMGEESC